MSAMAGIGDIGGGKTKKLFNRAKAFAKRIKGDSIHFQKNSTWAKAIYDKSLCFDGYEFRTKVSICTKRGTGFDDRRTCLEKERVEISQPMESKIKRCKLFIEKVCVEWNEENYIQKPLKLIEFIDDSGLSLGTFEAKIEDCK